MCCVICLPNNSQSLHPITDAIDSIITSLSLISNDIIFIETEQSDNTCADFAITLFNLNYGSLSL